MIIKPIHEEKKKLLYQIAIMMDGTRDNDNCTARMKLAEDLMEMIPNCILEPDPI